MTMAAPDAKRGRPPMSIERDPQHDEDLFALALRRLVNSFRTSGTASI